MRTPLALAIAPLIAFFPHAAPGALHGVATDRLGHPLAGVVVQLASTRESTLSAADGTWTLARTTEIVTPSPRIKSSSSALRIQDGRLSLGWNGTTIDGRRNPSAPAATRRSIASRTAEQAPDTISLRWKGAETRRTLPLEAAENLGAVPFDTTGLGRFEVRASRAEFRGLDVVRLDLVSFDSIVTDSLMLRLHLNGTAAEMTDFAAQLDLAQFRDAAGFERPTGLAPSRVSGIRPRLSSASCPDGTTCPWTFDIPLDPMVFSPQSRLALRLVVVRHVLSGDSTGTSMESPTHDPFAGTDWSLRPHHTGVASEYAGVPVLTDIEAEESPLRMPANPFVQILRGKRVLYGRGPSETP